MALFGTNGVRGVANKEITPELALRLAQSLGTYMHEGPGKTVAIGRDTRSSGDMLKSACIAGALSTGLSVIDLGIAPTPCVQYYVRDKADAGIVITASHNPREYNGIKLIAGDGTEFSRAGEAKVEEIYFSGKFHTAGWSETGDLTCDSSTGMYMRGILGAVDVKAVRSANLKVVVDTGCGAGSVVTPFLLKELGCEVISLNAQVDGTLPGREPEPTADNLRDMIALVRATGADLGLAHDGDADRVALVDEKGNFVNEDVLLAMMTRHVLSGRKGVIVTPVSSSLCVADVIKELGGELIWTRVGSIDVARKMMETRAVFGGEGNGGLIFPEHQYCRDGAMAAAKILEMVAKGARLSELASGVPHYYNVKVKVHCKDPGGAVDKIRQKLRGEKVDTTDGLKVWYDDAWVLIRPSGTEPLVRVYAESKKEARTRELVRWGEELVMGAVG